MQESMSLTWYVCSHALPFGTGTLFPFKAERRRLWRVAPVTHTREVCITIGLHHQQRTAGLAWGHMTIVCGAIQCMTPRGGCHRARRKTKPAVSPASRLIETTFTTLPSLTKRTLLSFSLCIAAVSFHHGIAIAFPDPPHTERSGSLALPRPSPSTSILPYLPESYARRPDLEIVLIARRKVRSVCVDRASITNTAASKPAGFSCSGSFPR